MCSRNFFNPIFMNSLYFPIGSIYDVEREHKFYDISDRLLIDFWDGYFWITNNERFVSADFLVRVNISLAKVNLYAWVNSLASLGQS